MAYAWRSSLTPCTLPCGHTWCQRCLSDILNRPVARCPGCRARCPTGPPPINVQFRAILQHCFGEAERAHRAQLPPNDTPLVKAGFGSIAIDRLLGIDKLLGQPGGMALNTQIIAHWYCDPGESPPFGSEIVLNIGAHGMPILLADVERALGCIPEQAWQRGRSYYWEGIFVSPNTRVASIFWGS